MILYQSEPSGISLTFISGVLVHEFEPCFLSGFDPH